VAEKALVIIPTYNEAVNLTHLVPQVLAQDPRLEVLVVDDNSPDGTGQLAEGLAVEDPSGAPLGVVREVFRAGEAEVYRIEMTDGGELLVPAVRDVVRRIDLEAGLMVVDYASEEVR